MLNLSSTITTGGTAQTIVGINPNRKGFAFQNRSAGDLYISFFGTATTAVSSGSILVGSGIWFEAPFYNDNPSQVGGAACEAISIIGATTGQAYIAIEW